MKFLLTLMILASAFGGFSAASHAMGTQDCTSTVSTQLEECQHADAFTDKDHAAKHEKSGAGKCMDCTHCCASSAVILQSKSFGFMPISAVYALESPQSQPQGRMFSLLRPPRILP